MSLCYCLDDRKGIQPVKMSVASLEDLWENQPNMELSGDVLVKQQPKVLVRCLSLVVFVYWITQKVVDSRSTQCRIMVFEALG